MSRNASHGAHFNDIGLDLGRWHWLGLRAIWGLLDVALVKSEVLTEHMPISLRLNLQQEMRRRFGRACYAGQSPCNLPEPTFYAIIARRVWFVAAWGISDHGAFCSTVALHGPRIARVDTSLRFVAIEWFVVDFSVSAPAILIHQFVISTPPHHEESFDWLIGRTLPRNLAWATRSPFWWFGDFQGMGENQSMDGFKANQKRDFAC